MKKSLVIIRGAFLVFRGVAQKKQGGYPSCWVAAYFDLVLDP